MTACMIQDASPPAAQTIRDCRTDVERTSYIVAGKGAASVLPPCPAHRRCPASGARRSLVCLAFLLGTSAAVNGQIRRDEQVVFFPTAARQSEDGQQWLVPLHGWIYEPETDDRLRAVVVRVVRQAVGGAASEEEHRRLEARCRLFLADNERGKQVRVRIADQTFDLQPSDPDGHFQGELVLPADLVRRTAQGRWLSLRAVTDAGDERVFEARVALVAPAGLSVISDIDDTIKVSQVTDRRQLLANTFLREFQPVSGMAATYRRWSDAGAFFHFVSSSPWQLFGPLNEFTHAAGFPAATYHLKRFRAKDASILNLFADPLATKTPVIESLLESFPHRRFVLVGDSGERDPEVFGELARRFPRQVLHIYIRDVTGESRGAERYARAFAGVPDRHWQLFTDPSGLMLPPAE